MKITITPDGSAEDTALLQGFATATGWRVESKITQEDWIREQVSKWVLQRARSGSSTLATADARAAYQTAIADAMKQSVAKIPGTVITVGVASINGTKPLLR